MTDRETLYSGLSNAAWGYFLLHFNFNLGFNGMTINILPEFAGCLLLLSAIGKLSGWRRDLRLLRPLCILLAVWHGVKWGLAIVGINLDEVRFVYLSLIVLAATLYFHFQFLTDMAALAERFQPEGETLDQHIRQHRTGLLILSTVGDLLGDAAQLFQNVEQYTILAIVMFCLAIVLLFFAIFIMIDLFRLRRYARDWEGPILE